MIKNMHTLHCNICTSEISLCYHHLAIPTPERRRSLSWFIFWMKNWLSFIFKTQTKKEMSKTNHAHFSSRAIALLLRFQVNSSQASNWKLHHPTRVDTHDILYHFLYHVKWNAYHIKRISSGNEKQIKY